MEENVKKPIRIQLAGPSGIGKTTICKECCSPLIPFISGSYSDLLPFTKDIPHKDMLDIPNREMVKMEYQLLNLRRKLYFSNPSYICDRSYLDSIAYFVYKLSSKISECEVEQFIEVVRKVLLVGDSGVDGFIMVPYIFENYFKTWTIEDNHKRITNGYFQWIISRIFEGVFDLMGARIDLINAFEDTTGVIYKITLEGYGVIKSYPILDIYTPDRDLRNGLVKEFIEQCQVGI